MSTVDDTISRLPRKNGNLRFEAPWQSRALGMALAINGAGLIQWGEFESLLEQAIDVDDVASFYDQWLSALVELMVKEDLITSSELQAREGEFISQVRQSFIETEHL